MKRFLVMWGVCAVVTALMCTSLTVAAETTAAHNILAEPIVVATEPEEIDEKVYFYQDNEKVSPEDFTWVDGKTGKALQLNGENQFLRYSAEKTLQLDAFTFSTWIYRNELAEESLNVGQKLLTVYKNENRFLTVSPHWRDNERHINGIYMEWQDRGIDPITLYTESETDTNTALETKTWHHVAVVASDDEFSLYVDGTCLHSAARDTSFSAMELNSFLIGGGFYGDARLHALLDDAYLYPQALDASHIALLAAGIDPADGGTPPTTEAYRPTAPTNGIHTPPVAVEDTNGTVFGIPVALVVTPLAVILLVVVLSVVLSAQKKRHTAPPSTHDESGPFAVVPLPTVPVAHTDEPTADEEVSE